MHNFIWYFECMAGSDIHDYAYVLCWTCFDNVLRIDKGPIMVLLLVECCLNMLTHTMSRDITKDKDGYLFITA